MRGLPAISSAEAFRVRRWDVLMLGSALPGLVASVRLAQRGLRVLILEESAAHESADFAREPFLLVGGDSQGVLGECLRALGIPLIDQRRFVTEEVALQVCDADCRIDLGRGTHTAEEWSSWGLASRDSARAWVSALEEAAETERETLLETSLGPRAARRAREATGSRRPMATRGWPASLDSAPAALRGVLEAPLRALSNLGERAPSNEAKVRLLGGMLRGSVTMGSGEGQLRGLLRRRIEALYGEFRAIDGKFSLVSVAQQPGLAVGGTKEIWTGRALVLNAPISAIAAATDDPVPDLLQAPPIRLRRHTLHFRGPHEQLSPCMASRVVWRDPGDGECVALRVFRGRRRGDGFDLLASVVVPTGDSEAEGRGSARIERSLRDLLPFSEGALERRPFAQGRWDTDALLADPVRGAWPEEPELRVSARPAIYCLERASVGGLGGEGELWLGWRAGDAIAEELA